MKSAAYDTVESCKKQGMDAPFEIVTLGADTIEELAAGTEVKA